jgi:hypothetical protein
MTVITNNTYKLTKEFLLEQHHHLKKSMNQIADETLTCRTTVKNYLLKYGIEIKNYRPGKKRTNVDYTATLTYDYLHEEHVVKKRSMFAISRDVGCDHRTIANWIHYHGVPYQAPEYNGRDMQNHPGWKGYKDISRTQFNNIRNNARSRGIECTVSIEELWDIYEQQDGKCALSGRPIGFVSASKGNASLDRKDSTKPYDRDNVWWVHRDVNYAKQSLSVSEFVELCAEVAKWSK